VAKRLGGPRPDGSAAEVEAAPGGGDGPVIILP